MARPRFFTVVISGPNVEDILESPQVAALISAGAVPKSVVEPDAIAPRVSLDGTQVAVHGSGNMGVQTALRNVLQTQGYTVDFQGTADEFRDWFWDSSRADNWEPVGPVPVIDTVMSRVAAHVKRNKKKYIGGAVAAGAAIGYAVYSLAGG